MVYIADRFGLANMRGWVRIAIPSCLTLASLFALLVACYAGVSDTGLYIFQVDVTNFSISLSAIGAFTTLTTGKRGVPINSVIEPRSGASVFDTDVGYVNSLPNINITAADAGLAGTYEISLWNYCTDLARKEDDRCSTPMFDWATNFTDYTLERVRARAAVIEALTRVDLTIPSALVSSLAEFSGFIRGIEASFGLAVLALAAELVLGFFAHWSRRLAMVTFIMACLATVLTCTAAIVSTIASSAIVNLVNNSVLSHYGISASVNGRFLVVCWISAVLSIQSAAFWIYSFFTSSPYNNNRKSSIYGYEHEKAMGKASRLDDEANRPMSRRRTIAENIARMLHRPSVYQQVGNPFVNGGKRITAKFADQLEKDYIKEDLVKGQDDDDVEAGDREEHHVAAATTTATDDDMDAAQGRRPTLVESITGIFYKPVNYGDEQTPFVDAAHRKMSEPDFGPGPIWSDQEAGEEGHDIGRAHVMPEEH